MLRKTDKRALPVHKNFLRIFVMISDVFCRIPSPVSHLIKENVLSDNINPANDDQMMTKITRDYTG